MYLHILHIITLTAAVLFHFSMLPFSVAYALAEHIDTETTENYCTVPLPDPKQLSEDEKEWFSTFQEGTFYVQGWKEITSKILGKIQQKNKKEDLQRSLDYLGIRIGCEWSKSNSIRKINTDMLEQWGSELQKIAEEKPDELPVLIANIRQKVFELMK